MKIFRVAIVKDHISHFEIESVIYNTELYTVNQKNYLKLNNLAADIIEKRILENKYVGIIKELKYKEVTINDLILENSKNELLNHKESALRKAAMYFNPQLINSSGLVLYGYMELNNFFNDKGYYITKENKQKIYLEILESGDEELIDKLEEYLNYKDEIERVFSAQRKLKKLNEEIMEIDDKNKITELLDAFILSMTEGNNRID